MELIDKARVDLEQSFEVRSGFHAYIAQTGEKYVVICSGGIKIEGDVTPMYCSTPEMAVQHWLVAAKKYADGKSGRLYWRRMPELRSETFFPASLSLRQLSRQDAVTLYAVSARLLITDQPETMKQVGREFVPIEAAA